MPPHVAVRELVRNNVDYVPIEQAAARIATTMFVVHPPGIASIVLGERLDERAKPMLDYLLMFQKCANLFPLLRRRDPGHLSRDRQGGESRFFTYVVRE